MPRVCVNMIVKNESANLPRCLAALAPNIDAYCICDTGSTDNTIAFIQQFFSERGIPGIVPTTTFRNFEQARNEALNACRASSLAFEYILFCDADMELVVTRPSWRDELKEPVYSVMQRHRGGDLEYPNIRLIRREFNALYKGVTHEYLEVGNPNRPILDGIWYRDHATGANRGTKFQRDIALLSESLKTDPNNSRSVFYLANSYYDLGDNAQAIATYQKRIAMQGWDQERYISSYRIGLCYQRMGREADFTQQMLNTFNTWPSRAEPLHAMALHEQRAQRHNSAYLFARAGSEIPKPEGALFVDPAVYEWQLLDIMAVSLFYMNRKEEALKLNQRVLGVAPASQHERIQKNVRWCLGTA